MTAGGDVDGVSVGEVDGAAEVSKGGGETAALALAAGVNDATGEELSMSDTLTEAEALRDDVAVRLAEALSDGDELDVAVRGGVAEDDHVSDAVCEDKGVELGLVDALGEINVVIVSVGLGERDSEGVALALAKADDEVLDKLLSVSVGLDDAVEDGDVDEDQVSVSDRDSDIVALVEAVDESNVVDERETLSDSECERLALELTEAVHETLDDLMDVTEQEALLDDESDNVKGETEPEALLDAVGVTVKGDAEPLTLFDGDCETVKGDAELETLLDSNKIDGDGETGTEGEADGDADGMIDDDAAVEMLVEDVIKSDGKGEGEGVGDGSGLDDGSGVGDGDSDALRVSVGEGVFEAASPMAGTMALMETRRVQAPAPVPAVKPTVAVALPSTAAMSTASVCA